MGQLERFFPSSSTHPQKSLISGIFSFLLDATAPDMRGPDVQAAYKGWVYAIAEYAATIEPRLERSSGQVWTPIDDHLALGPLQAVNPFMSSDDLWQVTQSHLDRDGNAFWYLSPGQFVRKSNENWPLDPTRFVSGYVYQNEKRENIPLDTYALKHTTGISGTVQEEIRLRIIEGVEQGVGTEEITSSIEGFFTQQTSWRAVRMARSEVISGYAKGSLAGYRQLGVVKMKPWLTAGGEKVDSEYALNEDHGPFSLESPFASGVYALITHPNCHYVLQPVRGSND